MEHGIINGFSNRDKLIERLVDSYNNKTAPEIILLTGPAGSGKSFVANNVVKKCEKISRMRSYINRGDSFVSPSAVGNMPKLRVDNLSPFCKLPIYVCWLGGRSTPRREPV